MTDPSDQELLELLADDGHVRIELSWLHTSAIEFTNRVDSGALLVVLQDSALMHGRRLLEFACHKPKRGYFRLADFTADAAITTGDVPCSSWLNFMNSQTSHLLTKRNDRVPWPHKMSYDCRDRMRRLADDVLQVFEANADQVRPGYVHKRFTEAMLWARDRLQGLQPPSPILPAGP